MNDLSVISQYGWLTNVVVNL